MSRTGEYWKECCRKANALMIEECAILHAQQNHHDQQAPEYWSEIDRQRWEPIDNDPEYQDECNDETG